MSIESGKSNRRVRHERSSICTSAADAAVVAEMRAASVEHKSDLFGPEARSNSDAELAAAPPAPQEISYQHGTVAGVPGWWVRPVNATPGARLLYLHGGGFVLGSATATRHFAAHLALRIRAEAFVPDYRLAPENPFPAAVEDAVKVYDALSATAEKIVVSGDSAGGGLALALLGTLAGRDEKQRQPVGVAVFSPWADLALTGDSCISRAEADPFVSKATLKHFADQYLKGTDPTNPAASPLYGLTPRTSIPVRIDVGNHEILFDDSVRYAEKLTRAGLSVSLNIWDGMGTASRRQSACWEIPPPRSRTSMPFFRAAYYSVSNNSRTDARYHASKQLPL